MEKDEVRRKYDEFARWYARLDGILEAVGLARIRRQLLDRARGEVLEVAAGTGRNLRAYAPGVRVTATDFSAGMLVVARRRSEGSSVRVRFLLADSEALPFPGAAFDTVVSSMGLCTYADPVAAVRELARVCRPEGSVLLLEHGRSTVGWLGRIQDRTATWHARALGCHWNREPLELVAAAGLRVVRAQRRLLGALHLIEAAPPNSPPVVPQRE